MKSSLAFLLFVSTTLTAAPPPPEVAAARDAIRPHALASHIRFLADDLLEGRETGSRGFELAARYVAAQFATFDLQPAGDDGTYFQHMRFRSTKIVPEKCSFVLHDGKSDVALELKKDFLIRPGFLNENDEVTAP